MTFAHVLRDITSLVGKKLPSISGRTDLTLLAVDLANNQVVFENASGNIDKRPIGELELIWEALNQNDVVHVDALLKGGGSSRNQPETIMANLPYVEYKYVNKKKHLTLASRSRPQGTIRSADEV